MAEAYLAWDLVVLEHRVEMVRQRHTTRNRRNSQNPLLLDDADFLWLYRVSKEMFHELVDELRLFLQRRRPYGVSTESQILTALRFYASGCYQLPVGLQWGCTMSQKSVSRVIRQVTFVINRNLLRKFVKFPMTQRERHAAKEKFRNAPHPFPDTIGAMDCTHVKILAPRVHEEAYVSGHHEGHSLNVQAVCDADLMILNINARWPGARHDAHIWANSPGTAERRYTEAHCSARCVVERCFGVLKSTFRCLSKQRQLMYMPSTAGQIVNACAVLHNMRIKYRVEPHQSPEEPREENDDNDVGDRNLDAGLTGQAVAERIRSRLIRNHFL